MKNDLNILEKFGTRLRELRLSRNISQEELGFRSKLDRTYISSVERGKRNISLRNIEKISKALNIDINEFFKNDN